MDIQITATLTEEVINKIAAEVARLQAPSPPAASDIYRVTDWNKALGEAWTITCSPGAELGNEYANIHAVNAGEVLFALAKVKQVGSAGARLLYDPRKARSWDGFAKWYGRTIEFTDTYLFPAEIANYYGDSGFMTAGWQFKDNPSWNANAAMAVNLHTFPGEGMRFWLQGNSFPQRAQDDRSPIIPVNEEIEVRLTVKFHDTAGFMRLNYAGHTLVVTGHNMTSGGVCGAYKALYGTCDALMVARQTSWRLID